MGYLFPLRLHLTRGGHVEGALGGVDFVRGELLLVRPKASLRVDLSLVDAVTPLGNLPPFGSAEARAAPPGMLTEEHVEFRLRPTWRSGLGLALSFVLPGAGQWIQKERPELGFLFLGGAAFFVASGLLALYGPSSYGLQQRATFGGLLFGLAGTVAIVAGAHAFQAGRERRAVRVAPKRPTRASHTGGPP